MYAVHLETMACEETSYGTDFGAFGMGYATDTSLTWRDKLYVANASQLAVANTDTWTLETVGILPSQSELTGNAAGELWAILPLESPAQLVQLDKLDAAVVNRHMLPSLPGATDIDTFAFATWGGDFWIFIRTYRMGSSTDVYRITSTGELSPVAMDTGMDVVGAGVSTCAPTE